MTLVSAWDQEPSLNGEARDGYWSEYDAMKQSDPSICMGPRTLDEARDSYWSEYDAMKQSDLVSAWDQEPSLNGEARDSYWSEYDETMKQSDLVSAWDQEPSLNGEARDGYWSEYDVMKQSDPSICMGPRTLLEWRVVIDLNMMQWNRVT